MRYDTTLAEDLTDLVEAIKRYNIDTEQIDALTVSAHNPGAEGAVVDVVLSHIATDTRHGARSAVFYDVDTDGRRSLAGALIDHSAAEQAEFVVSRLRWLANLNPSTSKEPTE